MARIRDGAAPGGAGTAPGPGEPDRGIVVCVPPGADPDGAPAADYFRRELGCPAIGAALPAPGDPGFGAAAARIRAALPAGARILCLGTGAEAPGAALLAAALGGGFIIVDPELPDPPPAAGAPARPGSLIVCDPARPGAAESAARAAALWGCGLVRLPYAAGPAPGRSGPPFGLAELARDYFAGGKLARRLAARPAAAPGPRRRAAICCTSNAVLKTGFARHLLGIPDERWEYRQFSVGGSGSAAALTTCLENRIPDEFDACLIDTPLNDVDELIGLAPASDFLVMGIVYALLTLFSGKRCKLVFLLHGRADYDNLFRVSPAIRILCRYADQATLIDYTSHRSVGYAAAAYEDPVHYGPVLQARIAKHLKTVLAGWDDLPRVRLRDPRAPRFVSLKSLPAFKDRFGVKMETSLIATTNLLLKDGDEIAAAPADLGLRGGTLYLFAVKYWDTHNTGALFARTAGEPERELVTRKKWLGRPIVAVKPANWAFTEKIVFGLRGGPGGASRGPLRPGVAPEDAELMLTDLFFTDTDAEELGRRLAAYWDIPPYFARFRAAAAACRETGDLGGFDPGASAGFVAAFLRILPAPLERIAFLDRCLGRPGAPRGEILAMLGDLYAEDKRPESAEAAWIAALAAGYGGDLPELLLKIAGLCLLELKDYAKAREWLARLAELPFGAAPADPRFCRYAFLTYLHSGDNLAAARYGKEMCRKEPEAEARRDEYREFLRKAGEDLLKPVLAAGRPRRGRRPGPGPA